MKPVMQRGTDDCLRASIASLLNIDYEESFIVDRKKDSPWWVNQLQEWALERGYKVQLSRAKHLRRWNYAIAVGPSPRHKKIENGIVKYGANSAGEVITHAVIVNRDLETVHDPYGENEEPLDVFYYLVIFTPVNAALTLEQLDGKEIAIEVNGRCNGSIEVDEEVFEKLKQKRDRRAESQETRSPHSGSLRGYISDGAE